MQQLLLFILGLLFLINFCKKNFYKNKNKFFAFIYVIYFISDLSDGYRINTLVAVFNICATIGGYLPNLFSTSKLQITLVVFVRLIFLVSFPLLILVQRTWETVNKLQ